MAVHWISADVALSVVAEHSESEGAARMALCGRASAGLLSARARLLTIGNDRHEHGFVPAKLWWARGHEALQQDWTVGDFTTWIDNRDEWRAYGVTFDLSGICEMLPAPTRPIVARRLSVAGDPDWITAQAARAFMYNELRAQPASAGELLIDQCRLGFVAARAVLMQRASSGRAGEWTEEAREWDVPQWYWDDFTASGSSSQQWERGVFAGRGHGKHVQDWMTLSSVHFSRASLVAMLPNKVADAEPAADGSRGRLPAPFWDELWCAVFGMIFRGELIPKTQADVQRAMLDWASNHDHSLSESSAKLRARRMFAEYQREGKKE